MVGTGIHGYSAKEAEVAYREALGMFDESTAPAERYPVTRGLATALSRARRSPDRASLRAGGARARAACESPGLSHRRDERPRLHDAVLRPPGRQPIVDRSLPEPVRRRARRDVPVSGAAGCQDRGARAAADGGVAAGRRRRRRGRHRARPETHRASRARFRHGAAPRVDGGHTLYPAPLHGRAATCRHRLRARQGTPVPGVGRRRRHDGASQPERAPAVGRRRRPGDRGRSGVQREGHRPQRVVLPVGDRARPRDGRQCRRRAPRCSTSRSRRAPPARKRA